MDTLAWEKGRESSFNAASLFYTKAFTSGGGGGVGGLGWVFLPFFWVGGGGGGWGVGGVLVCCVCLFFLRGGLFLFACSGLLGCQRFFGWSSCWRDFSFSGPVGLASVPV